MKKSLMSNSRGGLRNSLCRLLIFKWTLEGPQDKPAHQHHTSKFPAKVHNAKMQQEAPTPHNLAKNCGLEDSAVFV